MYEKRIPDGPAINAAVEVAKSGNNPLTLAMFYLRRRFDKALAAHKDAQKETGESLKNLHLKINNELNNPLPPEMIDNPPKDDDWILTSSRQLRNSWNSEPPLSPTENLIVNNVYDAKEILSNNENEVSDVQFDFAATNEGELVRAWTENNQPLTDKNILAMDNLFTSWLKTNGVEMNAEERLQAIQHGAQDPITITEEWPEWLGTKINELSDGFAKFLDDHDINLNLTIVQNDFPGQELEATISEDETSTPQQTAAEEKRNQDLIEQYIKQALSQQEYDDEFTRLADMAENVSQGRK